MSRGVLRMEKMRSMKGGKYKGGGLMGMGRRHKDVVKGGRDKVRR